MIHMIRLVSLTNEDERSGLRKICAWCNGMIREGVEPTSHGICPGCAEKEMTSFLGGGSFMRKGNPPRFDDRMRTVAAERGWAGEYLKEK
jgi:hypothetical protein